MKQDIAIVISRSIIIETGPRAYIGPSEMSLLHIHLTASFEDAQVNTQIGQRAEELGHQTGIGSLCFSHHARNLHLILRHKLIQIAQEDIYMITDETCVPQEIPLLHKDLCKLRIGFLRKGLDREDTRCHFLVIINLYVSITSLWSGGSYTRHQNTFLAGGKTQGILHVLLKA